MTFRKKLLEGNRRWAAGKLADDPECFNRLARSQKPEFLWIGCADARVPATDVTGLEPGELFVHRNIANLVYHTDINCQSVLEYAVDALKVKYIIICGHYNCGGIRHAITNTSLGIIDNWLKEVKDVYQTHRDELMIIPDHDSRLNRLAELNVRHQSLNACRTNIVQKAWARGQELSVHAWIYDVKNGHIHDLKYSFRDPHSVEAVYRYHVDPDSEAS
ncbi:MAG: carbonic anhydrase [Rhodospirillaceae bacterium]